MKMMDLLSSPATPLISPAGTPRPADAATRAVEPKSGSFLNLQGYDALHVLAEHGPGPLGRTLSLALALFPYLPPNDPQHCLAHVADPGTRGQYCNPARSTFIAELEAT